ncbi:MAG: shikimate dehydrogenase [Clostridia bacterium]|nr:shikimate dehydrogenase [Clostridia bacterium]
MAEYGLLGKKLGHSFSKEIHSYIGDYKYEPMEMDENELDEFLKSKDFKAVNVTIPYKQTVIPYLDEMTDAAKKIGAVNCIKNKDGKLIGHNTDFEGFRDLLIKNGVSLEGKKVLILGTGGTSDTVNAVCESMNTGSIIKVSRTARNGAVTYEEAKIFHNDAQIILNTTPSGMYPDVDSCPITLDEFNELEAVMDVIFNPLRTKLISNALQKNIKAEGGLYMLVAQAVRASEFFMDTVYPASLCKDIFNKILKSKTNIVLTGMPASGKTTIGTRVSEILQREFIDTDLLIEENAKMSIPEIFEKYGEAHFRELEIEAVKQASRHCGVVIATGGGAILREENIKALKMNGKIFFRDRHPDLLIPTSDRPTAFDKEQMLKRYEERYPIYTKTADFIVDQDSIKAATKQIIENL